MIIVHDVIQHLHSFLGRTLWIESYSFQIAIHGTLEVSLLPQAVTPFIPLFCRHGQFSLLSFSRLQCILHQGADSHGPNPAGNGSYIGAER